MKTVLPNEIKTIQEARNFLTVLYGNGEIWHPEDNAHESFGPEVTNAEKDQLNKLMSDIYSLPENRDRSYNDLVFDPCGFILSLDKDYIKDYGMPDGV